MDVDILVKYLENDLSRNLSPIAILSKFKVSDLSIRESTTYCDPLNYPFYYFLGKAVKPTNLLEIGCGLGFCSGSFLTSNHTAKFFLAVQPTIEHFNKNIFISNIKRVFKGDFLLYINELPPQKQWDLVLFNEEFEKDTYLVWLNNIWENMNLGGLIVINNLKKNKSIILDFVKSKNIDLYEVKTKNGTGIIER